LGLVGPVGGLRCGDEVAGGGGTGRLVRMEAMGLVRRLMLGDQVVWGGTVARLMWTAGD
jgi:hypothetical protein